MKLSVAGAAVVRRDLEVKLTGEARYTADLKLPGMLYGAFLRSPQGCVPDVYGYGLGGCVRLPRQYAMDIRTTPAPTSSIAR